MYYYKRTDARITEQSHKIHVNIIKNKIAICIQLILTLNTDLAREHSLTIRLENIPFNLITN